MNKRKYENVTLLNIQVGMSPDNIGKLDKIALANNTSRNEIIRVACDFLLLNKKIFKLKL